MGRRACPPEPGVSRSWREMAKADERLWEGRERRNGKASLWLSKDSALSGIHFIDLYHLISQ